MQSSETNGKARWADKVVVVYGALRSGTTMLRLMLDAHPDMSCPGESDFMLDHLAVEDGALRLNHAQLHLDRIFRYSGLSSPDARDGTDAFEAFVTEALSKSDSKVLVLMLHRGLSKLKALHPAVRIIHFVRDPRDVARSSIGMGWAGNTWYGVDHWLKTENEWERNPFPEDQILTLRYEDLLSDPVASLTQLCAHIGVPYDEAMMSYAETSTYDPVDASLAYQWKRKQSPEEVADVESKVGDLLRTRGYAASGHPNRPPDRMRETMLAVQNKSHIWTVRFRRYGVFDPIWSALCRRLGQPGMARSANLRMQEKAQALVK